MNYIVGASQKSLEEVNNNSLYNNSCFLTASRTYGAILNSAEKFIKDNAPVIRLYVSRYNYNGSSPKIISDDANVYALTAYYIPKNGELPMKMSKPKTLISFKLTNELDYILRSEGWMESGDSETNHHYYLHIKRSGVVM